jgi:hypothetical protein
LERSRQELDTQMRQTEEKKAEVGAALEEAAGILYDLTGQKYLLNY